MPQHVFRRRRSWAPNPPFRPRSPISNNNSKSKSKARLPAPPLMLTLRLRPRPPNRTTGGLFSQQPPPFSNNRVRRTSLIFPSSRPASTLWTLPKVASYMVLSRLIPRTKSPHFASPPTFVCPAAAAALDQLLRLLRSSRHAQSTHQLPVRAHLLVQRSSPSMPNCARTATAALASLLAYAAPSASPSTKPARTTPLHLCLCPLFAPAWPLPTTSSPLSRHLTILSLRRPHRRTPHVYRCHHTLHRRFSAQ